MQTPLKYGSHLPVLMAVIEKTRGDILELGCGQFTTPYLHWVSVLQKRKLLTLDNDSQRLKYFANDYQSDNHKFIHVNNWDKADIEKRWDVALVDHGPASRRVIEIKRLANLAKYIVIHDSNGRFEKEYRYSRIYPLFRYQFDFTKSYPSTTVLSNQVRLRDLV